MRAALPENRRAAFDGEIHNASVVHLPAGASHWAMPPEMHAEIETDTAPVGSGDLSDLFDPAVNTMADDPYAPYSALVGGPRPDFDRRVRRLVT